MRVFAVSTTVVQNIPYAYSWKTIYGAASAEYNALSWIRLPRTSAFDMKRQSEYIMIARRDQSGPDNAQVTRPDDVKGDRRG